MRKFTLLFMSMFFVLGTSMAQDKEEGPKDFNSPIVYPNSEKPETTVYNIRMQFSKNVAVTLPEGGIDVVNTTTQEVIKITTCRVEDWEPNVAMFEFEKKLVPGKNEGEEELQPQYIETAGAYTYTIPAGCIKSVDGIDEFPETTYTFTVISTFGVASFGPTPTDKLEKITITFDQEIVKVNMPEGGLNIADTYYTNFWNTKEEVVISDDKKTVTLELADPITEPGKFDLMLPQGVFESADGINAYSTVTINVIDTKPSFSTTYQDGDRVKEISNVFEITFKNVDKVDLAKGDNAPKISVFPPSGAEIIGTATCENNKITVTFDGLEEPTESKECEFIFSIPAGAFTMDGVENEAREITVTWYSFEIKPLEVVSVLPTESAVGQLDKIVVKFNQLVSLYYDEDGRTPSNEIKLTCGDKEYILNYAPSGYNVTDNIEYLVNASWNYEKNEWESTPITEAGTYTLNVADIIVNHGAEEYTDQLGYPNYMWHATNQHCEGTYTWTISAGEGEGIKAAEAANGEQVIYDLLGRRVEKITGAGIYIVNGKKVVIK